MAEFEGVIDPAEVKYFGADFSAALDEGESVVLPVIVTVTTDITPARTFQRDFGVRVRQG